MGPIRTRKYGPEEPKDAAVERRKATRPALLGAPVAGKLAQSAQEKPKAVAKVVAPSGAPLPRASRD